VEHEYGITLKDSPDEGAYDAIVLAVAHAPYKAMGEADFAKLMRHDDGVFADLKGLYRGRINTLEYWSCNRKACAISTPYWSPEAPGLLVPTSFGNC
jgi:hypothetical protein